MSRIQQRGVTVIELMITVTLLAVLMAVAIPSFADWFERSRVRGAADDVVSTAQEARAEAVRLNLPVTVAFQGGASWCVGAQSAVMPATGTRLPTAAAACDCTAGVCSVGGRDLRARSENYDGVTIDGFAAADDNYGIDPRLGVLQDVDDTPSITLVSPNDKYRLRIDVSPLGNARACIPDGSPLISGYGACAP